MGKKELTREYIIQSLRELENNGIQPSRSALERKGINGYWIQKLIPEGLSNLKKNLGIKLFPQESPLSNDDLLIKIDQAVSNLECLPTWAQLRRQTGITDKVFISHFGNKGIKEVLRYYHDWLEKYHPDSKNIRFFDTQFDGNTVVKIHNTKPTNRKTNYKKSRWPKISGKEYGAPLNFGSLIYEPTTEEGVVFLFGMVSKALGFSIERIGPEFPDCEAKRYIEGRRERQQHVKIEFEFRSRDYNHVVEGCDIIVCWENNWGSECLLEVIELRSKIQELRNLPEFNVR